MNIARSKERKRALEGRTNGEEKKKTSKAGRRDNRKKEILEKERNGQKGWEV